MRTEPVDYGNPLGISKREWIGVLAANLAILAIVYAVALVCTICGNDFFVIKESGGYLQRMEDTLRSWNVYPLIQIGFATVEETIILWFVTLRRPKWWWPASYFAIRVANNLIFANTLGYMPQAAVVAINLVFTFAFVIPFKREMGKPAIRFAIAFALSFALNGMITVFRTRVSELWHIYTNIQFFYLSLEYDLALLLALGLLALAIPWNKAKGEQRWSTTTAAGGSSPTSTNKSRTNSAKTRNNGLTEKQRRKIRKLKARAFAIQGLALVFVVFVPVLVGKPVEFSIMYVSFCVTRLVLGFNRSLHFKSEAICISAGAMVFWGLTILAPSVEVSIILSLVYGAGLALGFRLYWELHDLMEYRRASKNDRYAMMYVAFKGNLEPKHIRGVMIMKGYVDEDEIKIVQLYMKREKVEWIAEYMCFAKITIEKKLTEIATDLYQRR